MTEIRSGIILTVLFFLGQGILTDAHAKKAAEPKSAASNKAAESNEATPTPMDKPLLTVDSLPVTSRDYANFLQSHPSIVSRAANSREGKIEALRELVAVYLLRKAMYAEGLLKDPQKTPSTNDITVAYEKLAEKHFTLPPNPTDKEGLEYYQTHQADYGIPDMVRLSQILFKFPRESDQAVRNAARQRAEKALKRLESGEKFAKVAAEMTENPIGKVVGGDIGYVNPDEQEWMKMALKDMKPGGRTGVVESPVGYVILALTDVRPGLISPYPNVRDQVIKELRDSEQKKLRDIYVNGLAKEANIELLTPDMKALFPQGMFP
jgi:parvulin-like peptidyl-prolyl isomerase